MKTATVIKLLTEHPNKREISRETGIHKDWLYKVAKGQIKHPSSFRIDTLREFFESTYAGQAA